MKVALVTDWFLPRFGGIELHLADLARALAAHGHEVVVITTTPGPRVCDTVTVRRLRSVLAPGAGFAVSPGLIGSLRRELETGAFDVVHAHVSVVSPVGYSAVVAGRSLALPTVVTFHSVLNASVAALAAADLLFGWRRWPILVSAVSSLVAGQVRRTAPGLSVTVLPNGSDPLFWQAVARTRPENPKMVRLTSAMRLHRKKRPMALLQAFREAREVLQSHGRTLQLSMAGDGPERQKMGRFIAQHGLDNEILLLGVQRREDVRKLFADSDVFVLPTVREAFGLAALEARFAGLPVVAMGASGATEFLVDQETALLAADDAELARQIATLALDDGLRARLAPPDPGLQRFAWPEVVDTHLAAYGAAAELIGRTRTGA